jgi:hypothetical protein
VVTKEEQIILYKEHNTPTNNHSYSQFHCRSALSGVAVLAQFFLTRCWKASLRLAERLSGQLVFPSRLLAALVSRRDSYLELFLGPRFLGKHKYNVNIDRLLRNCTLSWISSAWN